MAPSAHLIRQKSKIFATFPKGEGNEKRRSHLTDKLQFYQQQGQKNRASRQNRRPAQGLPRMA